VSLDIKVPLQPKQVELLRLVEESSATWIAYGGSRGGAKSHGLRAVMLLRRLKHPGTAGLVFRRTFEQLWENHIQPLFGQYPFMRDWYHTGHKELTLPNGSRIVFGYAEHPGDISAFQGKQYMDIAPDEATHLTEAELLFLKTCNRWPGFPDRHCKMILSMNPGNIGHAFIKRVFMDRQYHENEHADDYVFLQARAWDNVEWARSALREANLSDKDYYGWPDEERFRFFLEKTDYGRTLDRLPQAMRIGHLLGSWDRFAGQYFDIFNAGKHTGNCNSIAEYVKRWLGIDWGRTHATACYWNAKENGITKTYREYCETGRTPKSAAQEIVDATPEKERKYIDAIYLSHDAFAERTDPQTIAIQMGEVFRANKMPAPTRAPRNPVAGALLIYELMRCEDILIDRSCRKLIDCLPMVTRDEVKQEDTVKFEGDDPYEAYKYGLQGRYGSYEGQAPLEDRVNEKVKAAEFTDTTSEMIFRRKWEQEEKRKMAPVKFARRGINHSRPDGY
jgi:terminase large subunit-like protein